MINSKYGIGTASPGAMLREQKKANTPLGIEAERITSQGNLLPDNLIVDLVKSWMADHDGAFVFDGFPRTCGQAESLETILNNRGTPLDVALSLDATFETIRDRVSRRMVCGQCGANVSIGLHVSSANSPCPRCGGALHRRADDNEATLSRRMEEYREKSEPLIDWYSGHDIVRHVNANRTPDEVFAEISAILEQ
jgi:adenylate kinase